MIGINPAGRVMTMHACMHGPYGPCGQLIGESWVRDLHTLLDKQQNRACCIIYMKENDNYT